jgi:hypothetical protein
LERRGLGGGAVQAIKQSGWMVCHVPFSIVRLVIGVFILTALVSTSVLATVGCATENTPMVVVRIDDGRASWRQRFNGLGGMSGLEYGKLKRIPITWAVVTDWASNKPKFNPPPLTWSELIDYVTTAGGELASHSVRHQAEASQADYIREIVQSKAEIEANAPGFLCTTFIQPGVWTNEAYLDSFSKLSLPIAQAIQQNYLQSMAYLGSSWLIGNVYYRYGFTSNICLDRSGCPSLSAIRATLDVVAATPGCIFILYGHGVQESGGNNSSEIQADVLKGVMDYLAELRDQGKVRLVSLADACSARIDPRINRLADGSLEVVRPGNDNPVGPVTLEQGAYIDNQAGLENSRCAALPTGSVARVRWRSWLRPGRYRISWWQKLVSGSLNSSSLQVGIVAYGVGNPTMWLIRYRQVRNTAMNTWEQRSLYALVPFGNPDVNLFFQQYTASSSFCIDGVQAVLEELDPSQAPSETQIVQSCGQHVISWVTPNDETVTRIAVRYDAYACPTTPNDGIELANVEALPGSRQSISTDYLSSVTGFVYVGTFAIRADGSWIGPDLAFTKIDNTPPAKPQIGIEFTPDGQIRANWNASDSESGICLYEYGLGTTSNYPDVTGWIGTTDNEATFSKLPSGVLYLIVRAKNNAGMLSQVSSVRVPTGGAVLAEPDGTPVILSGTVSAVFSDCFYVQLSDCLRGIKVIGNPIGYSEGTNVTVSGTLTTVDGERAIMISR